MRSILDLSSGTAILITLLLLVVMSVIAVGVRLAFMQTFQRWRERENRQINERLKVLIAAYKVLGGSFTGELDVSPVHLSELRESLAENEQSLTDSAAERRRRIRDAVEAALSDVMLLGTEEQVRMAAQAANHMVQGQNIETAALVVSLRRFIRRSLDLAPIPDDVDIPNQGPLRVLSGAGGKRDGGQDDGKGRGGGRGATMGGAKGGGGAGAGTGAGMGGIILSDGSPQTDS